MSDVPSLVGYTPDEAEAAAAVLGRRVVWVEAFIPRWLPPTVVPRVGRQRVLPDGTLELLRVMAPALEMPDAE